MVQWLAEESQLVSFGLHELEVVIDGTLTLNCLLQLIFDLSHVTSGWFGISGIENFPGLQSCCGTRDERLKRCSSSPLNLSFCPWFLPRKEV